MMTFLIFLITLISYNQQINQAGSLPTEIKDYLNKYYYKWEIAKISEKAKRFSNDVSNIITGDFDENGKEDLVIQITFQDSTSRYTNCPPSRNTPLLERQSCVIFMSYKDSIHIEQLTRFCWPIPNIFLRKYDRGTTKEAEMGNDKIEFYKDSFSLYSATGNSEDLFIYQENKFKIIQYADI